MLPVHRKSVRDRSKVPGTAESPGPKGNAQIERLAGNFFLKWSQILSGSIFNYINSLDTGLKR